MAFLILLGLAGLGLAIAGVIDIADLPRDGGAWTKLILGVLALIASVALIFMKL